MIDQEGHGRTVYLPIELSTSVDQSINPQEVIHQAVKRLLADAGDDVGIDELIRKEIQEQLLNQSKNSIGFWSDSDLEEQGEEEEDVSSSAAVAATKDDKAQSKRSSSRQRRKGRDLPPRRHTVDEKTSSKAHDSKSPLKKKDLPPRSHTEYHVKPGKNSNRRASYSMAGAEEMMKKVKTGMDASAPGRSRRRSSLVVKEKEVVVNELMKSPVKYNSLGSKFHQSWAPLSPSPKKRPDLHKAQSRSSLAATKKAPALAALSNKSNSNHERRLSMSMASSMANHHESPRERGRKLDAKGKEARRRSSNSRSQSRSQSRSRSRSHSVAKNSSSGTKRRSQSRSKKTTTRRNRTETTSKEPEALTSTSKRESIRKARSRSAGAAARTQARAKARREKIAKQEQQKAETATGSKEDSPVPQQQQVPRPQRQRSHSIGPSMHSSMSSGLAARRQRRQTLLNKQFNASQSTFATTSTWESWETADSNKSRSSNNKDPSSLQQLFNNEPSSLLSGRKSRNTQSANPWERQQARAILDEAFQDLPSLAGMEDFHSQINKMI